MNSPSSEDGVDASGVAPAPKATGDSSNMPAKVDTSKLINNRVAIFCMLFCVTGFLGIPLLCYSQAFSTREKIVWSIVVTVYTLILIGITAAIVYWALSVVFGW